MGELKVKINKLLCRWFGHDYDAWTEGDYFVWECKRCLEKGANRNTFYEDKS